jgi:Na+/H+-dicarboxylate symporter
VKTPNHPAQRIYPLHLEVSRLKPFGRKYAAMIMLLSGIIAGALLGRFFPGKVLWWKPVGDIYLDVLFISVIPLIFFSVSSAIANAGPSAATGRLMGMTIAIFTGTVLLAIIMTIMILHFFPIAPNFSAKILAQSTHPSTPPPAAPPQSTHPSTPPPAATPHPQPAVTPGFPATAVGNSALTLLVMAILIGVATRRSAARSVMTTRRSRAQNFLSSVSRITSQWLNILLKAAPLGLGIYFACQVAAAGPGLMTAYTHICTVGYELALLYYLLAFSAYAFIAGGVSTVAKYWKNNGPPSVTAFSTCSSLAALPSNLVAAEKMGIPAPISQVVLPLGAIIHKEGSAIVTVVGLSLIGNGLNTWDACGLALLTACLVSLIEGSIPNGGYTGQLLIMSVYHLPPQLWPVIIIISTLLDPAATLLNVAGVTASGLLIARWEKHRQIRKKSFSQQSPFSQ